TKHLSTSSISSRYLPQSNSDLNLSTVSGNGKRTVPTTHVLTVTLTVLPVTRRRYRARGQQHVSRNRPLIPSCCIRVLICGVVNRPRSARAFAGNIDFFPLN